MKLPKTPSKLLKIALKDLIKIERSKKYTVEMGQWHTPADQTIDNKCAVCLAGSVMAKTLNVDPLKLVAPGQFDYDTYIKLHALNDFRRGLVSDGIRRLDFKKAKNVFTGAFDKTITPYNLSPKLFKKDIRELIKQLEKVGF